MRRLFGKLVFPAVLLLAVLAQPLFCFHARAETIAEPVDNLRFGLHLWESSQHFLAPLKKDSTFAITSARGAAIYKVTNRNATLEPGEPTEGGIVTRSVWARYTPDSNGRVVLHTFGSDFDTVLAVYTGAAVDALTKVTANNDFNVPGVSSNRSLVQFDAVAGTTYRVQIGAVGGAQGNISLNFFEFGTDGGLAAFLFDVGGNPIFNARDHFCSSAGICPLARFILHNSTNQILSVVPSSTIGTRFIAPGTFSLAPGAVAVSTFTGATNSNFTTRTQTGQFIFSGRVGGVEVSRATHRGIATVRGQAPEATVQAAVLPAARAGRVNAPLTAFATIANTGNTPAIGCFIRAPNFSYQKLTFQQTNPATNLPTGIPNAPVDIPAGATRNFIFAYASQEAQLANVGSVGDQVILQCANGQAPSNSANRFVATAMGTVDLADMISISATLANDGIVNVLAPGGVFTTATVNIGTQATITARPRYVKPFTDSSATDFVGYVCETNPATGACLQPPAATVQFTAQRNVIHTFSVFVQRPATNPGFSPGERRMFLQFEQTSPPGFFGSGTIQLPVGATSVAARAQ